MHTTIACPYRIDARPAQGFTLVELMVTLALAALLTLIAVPSFIHQLRGWQRDSATRAFTAHIQLARSTAIKTSRRVVTPQACRAESGGALGTGNSARDFNIECGWSRTQYQLSRPPSN